jgi:hypothetical protein
LLCGAACFLIFVVGVVHCSTQQLRFACLSHSVST